MKCPLIKADVPNNMFRGIPSDRSKANKKRTDESDH